MTGEHFASLLQKEFNLEIEAIQTFVTDQITTGPVYFLSIHQSAI